MSGSTETPDNTKLIALLNIWSQNMSKESYAAVRTELLEGNSFLMLPSADAQGIGSEWLTYDKPRRLELKSVYTIEGIQILGTFTDMESLLRWSNGRIMHYTSIRSQTVLDICVRKGFKRIVINTGSVNIYRLDYYTKEETESIKAYW